MLNDKTALNPRCIGVAVMLAAVLQKDFRGNTEVGVALRPAKATFPSTAPKLVTLV